jgi:hypothetical protein
MQRQFIKTKDFKVAEEWDVMEHVQMTSEERQAAAAELRKRVYGENVPDIREGMKDT